MNYKRLPVIFLENRVVLPGVAERVILEDDINLNAVRYAIESATDVIIIPRLGEDSIINLNIEKIGVICSFEKVMKRYNGKRLVLGVRGKRRIQITETRKENGAVIAMAEEVPETFIESYQEAAAFVQLIKDSILSLPDNRNLEPPTSEVWESINRSKDVGAMTDLIAHYVIRSTSVKREVLLELNHAARAAIVLEAIRSIAAIAEIQSGIERRVAENIEKNQKEYYLREQLKVIWEELGEADTNSKDAEKFREKISALGLPEKTEKHLFTECDKLAKLPQGSNEAAVSRSYLETCLSLPWNNSTEDSLDFDRCEEILERDHYGMKKVKERILESVAVMKLAPESKGQIICLAGPPGVGKTSIARSVAEALGRTYVRVSLGGVRDEADIRGHRKTYIGAMAGRIIKALISAGTNNPLILLDEVDKLSSDYRGDPCAALLEVLDPEQNNGFTDHYVEVPFDLSRVLFITTANDVGSIPAPLRDRMDIISMDSYTHEEKMIIARRHLIPKQLKKSGLNGNTFRIDDAALAAVISDYTREAGVRNLERRIASLMRKAAKQIASGSTKRVTVKPSSLKELLGAPKYKKSANVSFTECGVVNGLAWTASGGEMLEIEMALFEGSGKLTLTGSLGDVMKESAQIAVNAVRGYCKRLGLDGDFCKKYDIHIHAPEGAVPKDGPSAGITMATALVSVLLGRPCRSDVAMTGEITLLGRVLPIGGLKEKSMAAYRHGVTTVIIPAGNEPDLDEVSETVKSAVRFVCAEKLEDVLEEMFGLSAAAPVVCTEIEEGCAEIPAGGDFDESSESRI